MSVGLKEYLEGNSNDSIQFRANNNLEPNLGIAGFSTSFFNAVASAATELGIWWTPSYDYRLRMLLHGDSMMSGIVYGETSRVKNMPYKLDAPKKTINRENKLSSYQKMLNLCHFGQGIRQFSHLFTLEFLTQCNGVFVEIIGKNGDRRTEYSLDKDDIESFAILDSARCWRTYDPEYPVIYVNPYNGERHIMHYSRVYFTSNFTQNIELARGLGICALARAYEAGRLVLAQNTYIYEKVTGQSPEIGLVQGMTTQQLQRALLTGNELDLSTGKVVYKDITFIGQANLGANATPIGIELVGLKGLPDGFNRKEEMEVTAAIIANAFGLDVREIYKAVSTGETKADADIQDQKSEGKGRADAMQAFEDFLNQRILPDEITYSFDRRDTDSDLRAAQIYQIRASARQTQLASGEIIVEEARILAAEAGDIPPEFLETQIIADDSTTVDPDGESSTGNEEIEQDDPPDATTDTGEKAYFNTSNSYFNSLLELSLLGSNRFISERGYNLRVRSIIQKAAQKAYLDGVQRGANNYTITTLDTDEQAELTKLTNAQLGYLPNLVEFIYQENAPNDLEVVNRLSLWVNKGLNGIFNAGLLAGAGNKMMLWRLGRTERHCSTCAKAEGQIHRAKDWKRANIIPQGDNLMCNGFRCDCKLEETTERAKGRLSRIPNHGKPSLLTKILRFTYV